MAEGNMIQSGVERSGLTSPTGRVSQQARRHNQMRREVIDAHPEVRVLTGPNPYTALAVPVLLAVHWGTAWAVSESNLLVVFLVSFFFGQIVIHATGTLVHETAHRLIFKDNVPKLLFDLGLETILASFARQLTYQHEHVSSHHKHIGDYAQDYEHEDICVYQARMQFGRKHPRLQRVVTIVTLFVNLLPLGFLVSDELYSRFYRWVTGHPVKDPNRQVKPTRPSPWEKWGFIAWSLAINVFLFWAFGFLGWLYHTWSLSSVSGQVRCHQSWPIPERAPGKRFRQSDNVDLLVGQLVSFQHRIPQRASYVFKRAVDALAKAQGSGAGGVQQHLRTYLLRIVVGPCLQ